MSSPCSFYFRLTAASPDNVRVWPGRHMHTTFPAPSLSLKSFLVKSLLLQKSPKMLKFKIVELFKNECSVALQELLFQKARHFLNSQHIRSYFPILHDFHSHGQTEAGLEPTSFPQLDETSCTSPQSTAIKFR